MSQHITGVTPDIGVDLDMLTDQVNFASTQARVQD